MTNHNNHNHNKQLIHHHKNLLPPPPRSNSTIQACAACRYQRRKCAPDCILAPYFPHDRQRQFQNAHKLFGVSNITKIIRNLDRQQKDEAMSTIIYQSDVRSVDPVGGCLRIIRELQRQIDMSCAELEFVLQQLTLYRTLSMQNNNNNNNNINQISHQEFNNNNNDLLVIDEIDYDIHLVNTQDDQHEPQLYDDRHSDNNNHHTSHGHEFDHLQNVSLQENKDQVVSDHSGWEDNINGHVVPPSHSWSGVHDSDSPPAAQSFGSSVCDEFKSLLISDIPPGDQTNEPSEQSLFDEETQKALIKVENVCYNEGQFEIEMKNNNFGEVTDYKDIHVEGEYNS